MLAVEVHLQRIHLLLRGEHLQIAAARACRGLRVIERRLVLRDRAGHDDRRAFLAVVRVRLLLRVRERQVVVGRRERRIGVVRILRGGRDRLLRGVRGGRRIGQRYLQILRRQCVVQLADAGVDRRLVGGIGEVRLKLRIGEIRVRDIRVILRRPRGRLGVGGLPVVVRAELGGVLAVARLRGPVLVVRIVRIVGEQRLQRGELLVREILCVARIRHFTRIRLLHAGGHVVRRLLAVQDHVARVGRYVQVALRGVSGGARLRVVGLGGLAFVGCRLGIVVGDMQHVLRGLQRLRRVVVLGLRVLDRLLHRAGLVVLDRDVGRRRRVLRGHALD
ncbi:hypothetical protein BamIOP4010DRAFT_6440 [Burkholderia ambifaria IOP40-10]|uniref:Uncharacterized protein n=1 Tax=Burkholderia ambifaria IOP40-10 TaxID=396596 RepID=B1FQX9_9BURK|nr:hypothetical protein BamIOP4010DRAFT_6440 [Burkholderia ambifaria IOP40-10]